MKALMQVEDVIPELERLGDDRMVTLVAKLSNSKQPDSGMSMDAALAEKFNKLQSFPFRFRESASEGTLFFQVGCLFGEWPKPKVYKDACWVGITVNLNDLDDGQVAWVESVSHLWIVQRTENNYRWFCFSKN